MNPKPAARACLAVVGSVKIYAMIDPVAPVIATSIIITRSLDFSPTTMLKTASIENRGFFRFFRAMHDTPAPKSVAQNKGGISAREFNSMGERAAKSTIDSLRRTCARTLGQIEFREKQNDYRLSGKFGLKRS